MLQHRRRDHDGLAAAPLALPRRPDEPAQDDEQHERDRREARDQHAIVVRERRKGLS